MWETLQSRNLQPRPFLLLSSPVHRSSNRFGSSLRALLEDILEQDGINLQVRVGVGSVFEINPGSDGFQQLGAEFERDDHKYITVFLRAQLA